MSEFIRISEIDTSKIDEDDLVGLSVFNADEEYLGMLIINDSGEYLLKDCFNSPGGIILAYAGNFWVRIEDCESVTEIWSPTKSEYAIDSNTMKVVKVLSVSENDTVTVAQVCSSMPEYIVQRIDLLTKESLDDYKRSQMCGRYEHGRYNSKVYINQLRPEFDFQNLVGLNLYDTQKECVGIITAVSTSDNSLSVLHPIESGVTRCKYEQALYKIDWSEIFCAELKYEGGNFAIYTKDSIKRVVKVHEDRAGNGNFVVKDTFFGKAFEVDPDDLTTKIFLGSSILRKPIVDNIEDDAGIPLGELLEKAASDKTKTMKKETSPQGFQTVAEAIYKAGDSKRLIGNSVFNRDGILQGVVSEITHYARVVVSNLNEEGNFISTTFSVEEVYLSENADLTDSLTVPEEKDLQKGNILLCDFPQHQALVEIVDVDGASFKVRKLNSKDGEVSTTKYQLWITLLGADFIYHWRKWGKHKIVNYVNLGFLKAFFSGQTVYTDGKEVGLIVEGNEDKTTVLTFSHGEVEYSNVPTNTLSVIDTDPIHGEGLRLDENLYPGKYVIDINEIKRVTKVGRFYTEVESCGGICDVLSDDARLYTNEKLEEINECLIKGQDIVSEETTEVSLNDLIELSVINRELKTGEKVYSIPGYRLNKDYYFEPILKELGVVGGLDQSKPYLRINKNVSKDILDENTKLYVLK